MVHLITRLVWNIYYSLYSKRFHGVGEQRKTKERNRNGILPARNWGKSQNKKERVVEGKEGNTCGQTPGFWKPVEWSLWVAGPVKHYWHVSIIGSRRATEACLQKFLTERELRQHGGNPVVQCRRFGISKRDSVTLFSLFSFSDVWSLTCLNSEDFPLFVLSQAIIHPTISSLWHVSQTLFYWSWLCSSWLANFTLY